METDIRRFYKAWYLVVLVMGMAVGLAVSSSLDLMDDGSAEEQPTVSYLKLSPVLAQVSDGLADIAGAVIPSVVNISTSKTIKEDSSQNPLYSDPFFRRFFGVPDGGPHREFRQRSLGSGVIVSPDGYVITNNHVVDGADEITVVLSDKREYKGKVVGSDPRSDVAVVKIDAKGLPSVAWADSDRLRPGEMVMAVGSPFGLARTVTVGIVSAIGRANIGITDYEDFIQTDAAINPGNSGGALVNMKGELVGINTAIFSQSGGYQGIGFAVPSNMVRQVMDSLIRTGKVVRGWLGVSVQDLTPELAKQFNVEGVTGALVAEVIKGGPAEKAGIKQGDVILELDGKPVTDSGHLRNVVASEPVGKKLSVVVMRDKKKLDLYAVIGELPKDMVGAEKGEQPSTESVLSSVSVQPLTPELKDRLGLGTDAAGVVVAGVTTGSIAEDAGLTRGDVIVSINREAVGDVSGYNRLAAKIKKTEPVLLLINRKGSMLWLSISPEG